jgi:hypothetical protein
MWQVSIIWRWILILGVHLSAPVNDQKAKAGSQEADGTGERDNL